MNIYSQYECIWRFEMLSDASGNMKEGAITPDGVGLRELEFGSNYDSSGNFV